MTAVAWQDPENLRPVAPGTFKTYLSRPHWYWRDLRPPFTRQARIEVSFTDGESDECCFSDSRALFGLAWTDDNGEQRATYMYRCGGPPSWLSRYRMPSQNRNEFWPAQDSSMQAVERAMLTPSERMSAVMPFVKRWIKAWWYGLARYRVVCLARGHPQEVGFVRRDERGGPSVRLGPRYSRPANLEWTSCMCGRKRVEFE